MDRAQERCLSQSYREGTLEEHLRRFKRRRVLGGNRAMLLRLQSGQQLEPRADRHSRALEGLRSRELRTRPERLQSQARAGLAIHVPPESSQCRGATGKTED